MTTLGFAVLGLLAREPLSGYDVTQRMKGRVGFFWGAGHSQIYPELARLEEGGFVTHSVVEQRERPDKKVFEITAAGIDRLKEWASQPPPRKPTKTSLPSRRTPCGSWTGRRRRGSSGRRGVATRSSSP